MKPEISRLRASATCSANSNSSFAPLAQEKGLRLRFVDVSLAVHSDRRLLRRLLQNLISNAIKYTPKGACWSAAGGTGARCEIGVYDTGVGIPRSQQRAIFREFHRLDRGARVARGLGLGLSIVERIAKVLDHPVGVTLARRPGLAVLRARAARATRRSARLWSPAAAREEVGHLGGMPVVCIDNEPKILDGMRGDARAAGDARC